MLSNVFSEAPIAAGLSNRVALAHAPMYSSKNSPSSGSGFPVPSAGNPAGPDNAWPITQADANIYAQNICPSTSAQRHALRHTDRHGYMYTHIEH
eukprot:5102143-Alexandrium_andersonii.AAC.1